MNPFQIFSKRLSDFNAVVKDLKIDSSYVTSILAVINNSPRLDGSGTNPQHLANFEHILTGLHKHLVTTVPAYAHLFNLANEGKYMKTADQEKRDLIYRNLIKVRSTLVGRVHLLKNVQEKLAARPMDLTVNNFNSEAYLRKVDTHNKAIMVRADLAMRITIMEMYIPVFRAVLDKMETGGKINAQLGMTCGALRVLETTRAFDDTELDAMPELKDVYIERLTVDVGRLIELCMEYSMREEAESVLQPRNELKTEKPESGSAEVDVAKEAAKDPGLVDPKNIQPYGILPQFPLGTSSVRDHMRNQHLNQTHFLFQAPVIDNVKVNDIPVEEFTGLSSADHTHGVAVPVSEEPELSKMLKEKAKYWASYLDCLNKADTVVEKVRVIRSHIKMHVAYLAKCRQEYGTMVSVKNQALRPLYINLWSILGDAIDVRQALNGRNSPMENAIASSFDGVVHDQISLEDLVDTLIEHQAFADDVLHSALDNLLS